MLTNYNHFLCSDGADRREGINVSVSSDVAGVFLAKKHSQLLALKEQIMRRIKSGDAGVDIGKYRVQLCYIF